MPVTMRGMLKHRLIFGPLMIAGLLLVLYLDNRLDRLDLTGTPWQGLLADRTYLPAGLLMLALFLALIPLAARELSAIFQAKGIPANSAMVAASGLVGCVLLYAVPTSLDSQSAIALFGTLAAGVFVATTLTYSWAHRRTQGAIAVCGVTLLALIYLGVLPGFYIAIRRWHSAWVVLAVILVTKCCDIGAYFAGRALGRHKLIPWLSPGKTWEGLAGGVLLSAAAAVALAAASNHFGTSGVYAANRVWRAYQFPLAWTAVAGAVLGLVGQFGDLLESLFKRDAGVKDSGATIPGFGGVLDVIDSPIVVAPVAYWFLRLAATAG